MSKVSKLYTGNDTFGKNIELALSENGNWYYRVYQFNGYSNAWTKWDLYKEEIIHKKSHTNQYDGSVTEIPDEDQHLLVQWGFNYLRLISGEVRYRLPN